MEFVRDLMNYGKWIGLIGLIVCSSSCENHSVIVDNYNCDLLVDWNRAVMEYAIEEDGLLSLKGVRTEAMMHGAIHNAINSIVPKYTLYGTESYPIKADPIAAAAQAAYQVVVNQYPDKEQELKKRLAKWIDSVEHSNGKEAGIQLGKTAAEKMLKI